jgi:hypothetical protein
MAWLRIDERLVTHRKTMKASESLDILPVHFIGHAVSLWLWALEQATDGDLSDASPLTIARAAQWTGDPKIFTEAMKTSGFIDVDERGMRIHDWEEYGGKLLESRDKAKKRMRQKREAEQYLENENECSRNKSVTFDEQDANKTRTERERYADVHEPKSKSKSKSKSKKEPLIASEQETLYGQAVEIWNRVMPEYGGLQPHAPSPLARRNFDARVSEDHDRGELKWWRSLFNFVLKSSFLLNREGRKGKNGHVFKASFDWLIAKEETLSNVISSKYHDEEDVIIYPKAGGDD